MIASQIMTPTNLQLVRVFLASPSDLTAERTAARDAVEEINKTIARPNGFHIDLIGWEDTISERRRPQEAINEDLETCELFVGMMWKKWGTAPDVSGPYTSGFQEEFSIATGKHDKTGTPTIRLYFKDVDSSLLNDPGEDLKKVLAFKKLIEDQKKTLYETFKETTDFASKFRVSVADYINRLRLDKERAEKNSTSASKTPTAEVAEQTEAEPASGSQPTITPREILSGFSFFCRKRRGGSQSGSDR